MKIVTFVFLLLALTSCSNSTVDSTPAVPTDPITEVKIKVYADSEKDQFEKYSVLCSEEEKFCEELEASKVLDYSNPAMACTEVYGGPQMIELTVSRDDTREYSYTRRNGCEIGRYDSLVKTFDAIRNQNIRAEGWNPDF